MLGENHSLTNEFPEYMDTINKLIKSDKGFEMLNATMTLTKRFEISN